MATPIPGEGPSILEARLEFFQNREIDPEKARNILVEKTREDFLDELGHEQGFPFALESYTIAGAMLLGLHSIGDFVELDRGNIRLKSPDEIVFDPQAVDSAGIAIHLGFTAIDGIILDIIPFYADSQNAEIRSQIAQTLEEDTSELETINSAVYEMVRSALESAGLIENEGIQSSLSTLYVASIALTETTE